MVAIQKFCTFVKANDAQCNCYRVKNSEFCSFHSQIKSDDSVKMLQKEVQEIKKILQLTIDANEKYKKNTDEEIYLLKGRVQKYEMTIKKQQNYMNLVHFVFLIMIMSIVAYLNKLQLGELIKVCLNYMKVYKSVIQVYVKRCATKLKENSVRLYKSIDFEKIKVSIERQLLFR